MKIFMLLDKQNFKLAYEKIYQTEVPNKILTIINELEENQSATLNKLDKDDYILFLQIISKLSTMKIPLTTSNMRLGELQNGVREFINSDCYHDLDERTSCFLRLKNILKELSQFDEEIVGKEFKRVVIMLFDTIRKYKAENITAEQYEVLSAICKKIANNDFSKGEYAKIDSQLLNAGLDWAMGSE
ncbi:hypothetical protein QMA40_21060 [Bacillus thuringiensis]|uniref:hypothetical protein n=1 Tax=Bacillus thuringiensis TaxID=1428 RepID=UPI0039774AFA